MFWAFIRNSEATTKNLKTNYTFVNPIQDGLYRGCSQIGEAKEPLSPLHKICCTYLTMMRLCTVVPYLNKIQKMYESRDTPFEFCWHQHFSCGNEQIELYQEIQMQTAFWYIISISFNTFRVFKDIHSLSIYMLTILMMSAKMATLGLLKGRVFWDKGHDVVNKILSRDSNCIVWPKFGNSNISMREVSYHNLPFIRIWPEKLLFWGVVLVQVQ